MWKHVSHDLAIQVVHKSPDPSYAARKLRDLAIAHGCQSDVSVIVVQLNETRGRGPDKSLVHTNLQHTHPVPAPKPEAGLEAKREQDQDQNVEFTNIDDILSDSEDDMEQDRMIQTWNGVQLRKKKSREDPQKSESKLDQLLLSAVSSPLTSATLPEMKSTNIDDILQERGEERKGTTDAFSVNYPAQTIPRDAAGSRDKRGKVPPPASKMVDYDKFYDSYEITQSSPYIPSSQGGQARGTEGRERLRKGGVGLGGSLQRERRGKRLGRSSKGEEAGESDTQEHLAALNQVMSALDSDAGPGEIQYGGMTRRLSYVEHSYKQLTNDVYSDDLRAERVTNLDDWDT